MNYVTNTVVYTVISSLDEICSLVLLVVVLFRLIHGFKLMKAEVFLALLLIAMCLIGLISNLFSNIQPLRYALVDMLTCSKFVIVYLGIRAFYTGKIPETFFYDNFNRAARFLSVLYFALTVHDYLFTPFFPQVDFRYFALSTKLFFPHPTYLANSCIILICILCFTLKTHRSNMIYIWMLLSVAVMTFRAKAVAFAALFLLLNLFVAYFKVRSKFLLFLPLTLGGLYIGWDQIQYYFVEITNSARAIMSRDCVKIANRFFPLGAGFGTYGSFMANIHYSALYRSLGYNGRAGMSEQSPHFLSDTFWPIVIGQFGYFGLICFLGIAVCFFIIAFHFQDQDHNAFIALLSVLLYMMISSTSESSFFNPYATLYFIIFGLMVSQKLSENKAGKKKAASAAFQSKYIKQGK
ncbi:MAG: hypothetical protein GX424_11455 [Clostridiales bacterium]|nr:hypothetical protein [Clostridiales bacterium]